MVHRTLKDFLSVTPADMREINVFEALSNEEILKKILSRKQWRYHHGLDELSGEKLYKVYAERVDSMLDMIETGLKGYDLSGYSACDLGCAEGFTALRFRARVKSMDCFDLNEEQIQRVQLLAALFGSEKLRVGRLDLEQVNWPEALPMQYDVIFALGVVYHMENPALFCRALYEATGKIAIVESDTPVFDNAPRFRGNGVVYMNADQVTLAPGHIRKLMELRPDQQALEQMLKMAGFSSVRLLPPSKKHQCPYFENGEKSVFLCEK